MDKQFVNKILGKDVTAEQVCAAYDCNESRIIHPDDMVTMDYKTKRVNIVIDNSDVILRIYVG